ncbi:MAG TPA: BMP family ABC transporter substrate-binding protein [Clostridiaceae bacterium]|nr:BMP family ABC transporter substrate-binding protein [Clostridiaceae bacterium]HBN28933.1 BMP family ABC transporter substrate-binding protein [Clostridiaceae bacterium]HCL49584.1 BMP family ABC transporter substrate-binding protein [Clostridiaceae bacterium]
MKKLTSLLVAILMVFSMTITGCGKNDVKSTDDSKNGEKQTEAKEDNKKPLKVLLFINGNLGDKSFFDSANNGMKLIKEKYGCETKTIEVGTDRSKWEPALEDVSEQDYDIIIVGTFDMDEALTKVAAEHPDKKYIMFDYEMDYKDGKNKNVYSMRYKANESSFLAGALAAKMSKSHKLGFVGGMDIPLINDFLVGYIQGAQYVDKNIKVLPSYVGNFNDPAKGKEMALAQYNQGIDIVYNAAGQTGLGVLDAAKEVKKLAIGSDSDQAMLYKDDPEKANLILTSILKRVDNSIVRAIDKYIKGELEFGKCEVLGLKEECVGLAENEFFNKNVPEDVRKQLKDLSDKIVSGEIKVDTGLGMSNDELDKLRDSVRP